MPTAENEQMCHGEQTGREYDFQSAESRPFTLTSKIDATLPRFQIKEGDMWESLNGRNQPLIQVAPAIVHETKLQHREVWELEWVLTVGWFWVVPLWPTVWLLTSLFIISVMAKIGYSAFKKLNRTWATVRSHRLRVHSDVWELWSRPHFARLHHCRRFLFSCTVVVDSGARVPLMFVGISDCLARRLHPLPFIIFFSPRQSSELHSLWDVHPPA